MIQRCHQQNLSHDKVDFLGDGNFLLYDTEQMPSKPETFYYLCETKINALMSCEIPHHVTHSKTYDMVNQMLRLSLKLKMKASSHANIVKTRVENKSLLLPIPTWSALKPYHFTSKITFKFSYNMQIDRKQIYILKLTFQGMRIGLNQIHIDEINFCTFIQ